VTFSMRSPLAMSNGCAGLGITLFTSSMSAVAGSYSRSVVSPWMKRSESWRSCWSPAGRPFTVFCGTAVSGVWVPSAHIAPFLRVVNAQRAFQPVLSKTKRT
jgi:hypothetical protein